MLLRDLEILIKDTLSKGTPESRYEIRKQGIKIEGEETRYEVTSARIEKRTLVVKGEEIKVDVVVLVIGQGFDYMDYKGPKGESTNE
jgi:hypothetical protein